MCVRSRESISPSGNHDVVREKKGLLVNTGQRRKQPRAQETEQTVSLTRRPPFLAVPSLFIDHSCERFEQPEFFFFFFLLLLPLLLANILWIPYFLRAFFAFFFFSLFLSLFLSSSSSSSFSFARFGFLPALVPTILGSTLLV